MHDFIDFSTGFPLRISLSEVIELCKPQDGAIVQQPRNVKKAKNENKSKCTGLL